MVDTAE
jgi:hypothetical protein